MGGSIIPSQQTESNNKCIFTKNNVKYFKSFRLNNFARQYDLKVKPNNFLIAPKMKMVVRDGPTGHEVIQDHPPAAECHFLQVGGDVVAAISHCSEDAIVRNHKASGFRLENQFKINS